MLAATILVVTNLARNAISVDPVKMKYPMSIFPPAEQARIRAAQGLKPVENAQQRKAKRINELYDRDLERAEARHKAGLMTDDELKRKRAAIAAARERLKAER